MKCEMGDGNNVFEFITFIIIINIILLRQIIIYFKILK